MVCDAKQRNEADFIKVKDYLAKEPNSSLTEACFDLKISYSRMYQFLKRYHTEFEINCKNNGKQRKKKLQVKNSKTINETNINEIKKLYFDDKLTFKQIGEIYKLNAASICNFFKQYGIKARSTSEASKLVYEMNPYKRELARIRSINRYVSKKYNTQPELDFIDWLNSNNIRYEQQFRKVGNSHPYDFLLNDYNLLVEIDGHYWHSNQKQQIKDEIQTKQAIEAGFNIVRIDTEQLKKYKGDYGIWLNKYMKK